MMLNIPVHTLDAIGETTDMAQDCLLKIISEWLYGTEGPHTKARIVEVLRKKAVGLNALAKKISENNGLYTHTHTHTHTHTNTCNFNLIIG